MRRGSLPPRCAAGRHRRDAPRAVTDAPRAPFLDPAALLKTMAFFVAAGPRYHFNPAALCAPVGRSDRLLRNEGAQSDESRAASFRLLLDSPLMRRQLAQLARGADGAPCLCALHTTDFRVAVGISEELAFVVRLCASQGAIGHVGTVAHRQMLAALTGGPPGAPGARGFPPHAADAAAACERAGAHAYYCAREKRLWFGRTPEDKRLLRRLGRALGRQGVALSVRKPTVYERVLALRPAPMQVVELRARDAPSTPRASCADTDAALWRALAELGPP